MIPEGHKEDIIDTGIEFIRAITEAYGHEEGMVLWDNIASNLKDIDIKGEIFFELLTGSGSAVIHLRSVGPSIQLVPAIKAIRSATGMGLKEAKDVYDAVRDGKPQKIKLTHRDNRKNAVFELRSAGMII